MTTGDPAPNAAIDVERLTLYRLGRLQKELRARDLAAALLFDPINVRYATGTRNMQIWHMHAAGRHALVPAQGGCVLFEFRGCEHMSSGLKTISEVRLAPTLYYFGAGPRLSANVTRWADEIRATVRTYCGAESRIAVDRLGVAEAAALSASGLTLVPAEEAMEHARVVKSSEEVACMRASLRVCEAGMARMQAALEPGTTENALWALLHETCIGQGGEWFETRLLSSGPRTNPWLQECSDRIIGAGDLVAFDSDMVGPHGYCSDISRTFLCCPERATPEQRRLYGVAREQLQHNLDLLRPGLSFRELSDRAWNVPDEFVNTFNTCIAHGVGMVDEYPRVTHPRYWDRSGYDGVLEPGMTICVHSYIGATGGSVGVMLEEQVLITERGVEILSSYPFEAALSS